jgi:hypothetical protein
MERTFDMAFDENSKFGDLLDNPATNAAGPVGAAGAVDADDIVGIGEIIIAHRLDRLGKAAHQPRVDLDLAVGKEAPDLERRRHIAALSR